MTLTGRRPLVRCILVTSVVAVLVHPYGTQQSPGIRTLPALQLIQVTQGGGLYNDPQHPLGTVGDGKDKHHMPPKDGYKDNPNYHTDCGPAILMDPTDHHKTASSGSTPANKAFRQSQRDLINAGQFAQAFENDVADILAKEAAGQIPSGKYDNAINQARQAMNDWMADCIARKRATSPAPPVGSTAVSPATGPSGTAVTASTAQTSFTPGDRFDLVGTIGGHEVILSPVPGVVNGSGNVPSTSGSLGGVVYWESGGEQDTLPATATVPVYFANTMSGVSRSVSTNFTVRGC